MPRPSDKHIDSEELEALVAGSARTGAEQALSPEALLEAERHVKSCSACSEKVSKYEHFMSRSSDGVTANGVALGIAPPGANCPKEEDVDWHEVAAGLWPEAKAKQLIMHAAQCDHCGPLLHAATSVDDDPTPEEVQFLAKLKAPSRPDSIPMPQRVPPELSPQRRRFVGWMVPALGLAVLVFAVLSARWLAAPTTFSGEKFAEFAVNTHRQRAQGNLALDLHSDSQQALNEQSLNDWLKAKAPFHVALPASPDVPGMERPYRLQGARLVSAGGRSAVFIAYQMRSGPVSLMVTPDSVAVASGGVVADFKKVSFHYRTVEGFKVVTWSLHGNTYALVSQEGNSTQQSCMVCHSAMRDRDLSQTPAPLRAPQSVFQ